MTADTRCRATRTGDRSPRAPVILSTSRLPDELLAPLGPVTMWQHQRADGSLMPREDVLAVLPDVDAIINQGELRVDAALLARGPRLRIVANISRGFDNLDLPQLTAYGVWATNVPGAFSAPTAEVALGLLLMVARRLAEADRFVRAGHWTRFDPGRWDGTTLVGKTIGLIGFGQIGREVAQRAAAFGMNVVFHCRTQWDLPPYRWLALDDLLAQSDVVSLHVPATPETHHLINAERLAKMKQRAILINTARGSVVDERALVAALQTGWLSGAGLDVVDHEPEVPPELRELANVVVMPHLGGGTVESRRAARELAIANVAAVLRGQPPLTPLNTVAVRQGADGRSSGTRGGENDPERFAAHHRR